MIVEEIKKLQQMIDQSRRIVFFGGAGVSTESGIPDFRSEDGLYHKQYDWPPETIISHSFFMAHPEEFFRFYRDKMLWPQAKPNAAHLFLAQLEQCGRLCAVITQNIDGLHQMAGSRRVLELHGSVHRNYCMNCHRSYPLSAITDSESTIPRCSCGGIIKPDVVLYEESLDEDVLTQSINALEQADLVLVGGTSLNVYPAAGLLRVCRGTSIVLINRSPTPMDQRASLLISQPIGQVFSQLRATSF